ncbi:MAG TPA: pilus assembly protein PilY, partial [Burkholderiaceae bacterium]|nr:pilus assembly protein PilY [Burkholderiaceae bacterium]
MTSRIPLHRALAGVLFLAASAATWAQSTLPSTLSLSKEPLLGVPPKHPNVVLALSVEFPTVGAAFNRITYVAGTKYVGYFNPNTCYLYDSDNNYFYPSGSTGSNYTCTGKFSGNFLNWATMSSIDVFRYALTGGYRVVDTTTQTILARTYLPNNETPSGGILQPSNFYAHATYFPRRWVSTTESGNNGNIATVAPSSVTPFTLARMSVVNCRGDVLFGEWDSSGSPTCAAPLRDGRFAADDSSTVRRYKVRVLVCDATEGPARGDFCGKYQNSGSPIYKPIGEMQKNADNMRFSVFGYVIDQSTTRYGGVMRTEMKYVGPNAYDATFRLTGSNTRAEWSTSTGIFTDNPDAASEGNSGVVNYLNKFGNLSGHEGVYKRYDPVGELYYEGLRYLMGKAPSTAALSGAPFSAGMKQGFPVVDWTNSADPLVCSSQPQYVIAIADTNAWGDKTIPGNTYTSENDAARAVEADGMNVLTWTLNVGLRAKADGLLPLTDGAISSSQADTLDTWVDGGRGNSFAMAGLAYWASTQDIRTDASKPVNTGKQTVTTITIDVAEPSALKPTERQLFLAGAYGGASDPHNPNWMLASNPDALIAALQNAFARVTSTSGSIGGGTITAGTYVAGDTGIFVPYFDTSTWFGELEHYAVSVDSS